MDSARSHRSLDTDTGTNYMIALARAKHPRTPMAGPYGHPFHPLLVTVPIGAWVASVVFDIVAQVSSEEEAVFAEGAYWLIGIGILGALAAAMFGLIDFSQLERGTRAFATGLTHMVINLSVVVLFVINFLVRQSGDYEKASMGGLILSLVGIALLGASGWLGGKLAYRYGVRVAAEPDQAEGYR